MLPAPRSRALIACQVQFGPGRTWTDRTYEVRLVANDGDPYWQIDLGEGPPVRRASWDDVLDWLRIMAPRDLELVEVP